MSTAIPTTMPENTTIYDTIPNDTYPARIVRFVGLGIQEQPEFQGQKKRPAFKCSIQFELIGVDATGTKADGTPIEPRPACVFKEYYLFPGATRGGVFELAKAVDASMEAAPSTLEWFTEHLGSLVNVQVGSYVNRKGQRKNKVVGVSPVPGMFRAQIGEARCELVGFNPYIDNEAALAAYSKLFKFQRDIINEAHDRDSIPFAGREPLQNSPDEQGTPSNTQPQPSSVTEGVTDELGDDDIPF